MFYVNTLVCIQKFIVRKRNNNKRRKKRFVIGVSLWYSISCGCSGLCWAKQSYTIITSAHLIFSVNLVFIYLIFLCMCVYEFQFYQNHFYASYCCLSILTKRNLSPASRFSNCFGIIIIIFSSLMSPKWTYRYKICMLHEYEKNIYGNSVGKFAVLQPRTFFSRWIFGEIFVVFVCVVEFVFTISLLLMHMWQRHWVPPYCLNFAFV